MRMSDWSSDVFSSDLAMLLDHLGIRELFCVSGGSMGGMQVLQWAASYPERVFAAVPIASAARHSAQNIAFHEVGRQAIYSDPDWREGGRSEEHTSELQSLMRISYAVFCLKKKRQQK